MGICGIDLEEPEDFFAVEGVLEKGRVVFENEDAVSVRGGLEWKSRVRHWRHRDA